MTKLYLSLFFITAYSFVEAQVVTSVASGNWNNSSTWSTGTVPTGSSKVVINNGHSVIADAAATAGTITIQNGGTLNAAYGMFEITDSVVNSGTFDITGGDVRVHAAATTGVNNAGNLNIPAGHLQIGGNGFNDRSFVNTGSFSISGIATFDLYGNMSNKPSAYFTQSGGYINVDGNAHGDVTKSVAAGTNIVEFLNPATQITLSAGNFCIVDPHLFATPGTYTLYFNNTSSTPVTASTSHTLQFNNFAYSTDSGGNSNGFYVYMTGYQELNIGDLTIVGSAAGANRHVKFEFPPKIYGNMLVLNWGEYRGELRLLGNATVAPGGTLTVRYASFEGGNNQTVDIYGTVRNDAVTPTANFISITVSKTPGTSVTFTKNVSVRDILSFENGLINMNGNTLTLGTSSMHTGSTGSMHGYIINGKLKRWISTASANYDFPIGTTDGRKTAAFSFNAPATGGTLTAEWISNYGGTNGLPLVEGSLVIDSLSREGYWRITAADGLLAGNYNASFTIVSGNGVAGVSNASKVVLLKRADETAPWALNGTHITTTGAVDSIVMHRDGLSGFSDFGTGISVQGVLPMKLISLSGKINGDKTTSVEWKVAQQDGITDYVVERSADGSNFETLGSVKAIALQDTYRFTDATPFSGKNYYRLKIAEGGKVTYSSIVLLSLTNRSELFIYPVPAKDVITIQRNSNEENVRAVITDMNGRIMMHVYLNQPVQEIRIASLPKGMYVFKTNGKAVTIIKQ